MQLRTLTVAATAAVALGTGLQATQAPPLSLKSARVTIEGTSNIHGYTASSTAVKITALRLDTTDGGDVLARALEPNGVQALDVIIPTASLTSPRDGIDKNMHKALKASEHPDIRFRMRSLDVAAGTAVGALTIAGVKKDVTLTVQVKRQEADLAVTGTTTLLMTDYGVTPPKAMLGMLKTNPKVTITFELTLAAQEPAVTVREPASGLYVVAAHFAVAGPPALVQAVLTDYPNIPKFMPGVRTSRVIEQTVGRVRLEQEAVSKFMMFSKTVHLLLEVEETPGLIRFRDECHRSFAVYEGSWTISPQASGAAVTYELTAKPAFGVPGMVLRRLLERDSKEMIDGLRREIAARVPAR